MNTKLVMESVLLRRLASVFVSGCFLTTPGCVKLAHEVRYSALGSSVEQIEDPYYHSPQTGRIVVRPRKAAKYCYAEPPFYGYEATCWQRWPDGWVGCPCQEEEVIVPPPTHEAEPLPATQAEPPQPHPTQATPSEQPQAVEPHDVQPSPSDRGARPHFPPPLVQSPVVPPSETGNRVSPPAQPATPPTHILSQSQPVVPQPLQPAVMPATSPPPSQPQLPSQQLPMQRSLTQQAPDGFPSGELAHVPAPRNVTSVMPVTTPVPHLELPALDSLAPIPAASPRVAALPTPPTTPPADSKVVQDPVDSRATTHRRATRRHIPAIVPSAPLVTVATPVTAPEAPEGEKLGGQVLGASVAPETSELVATEPIATLSPTGTDLIEPKNAEREPAILESAPLEPPAAVQLRSVASPSETAATRLVSEDKSDSAEIHFRTADTGTRRERWKPEEETTTATALTFRASTPHSRVRLETQSNSSLNVANRGSQSAR